MSTNNAETFLTVCENIAAGDTVAQACKAAGVTERSFFRALAADDGGSLGQAYARVRRLRADKRAAEIEDLVRRACLPKDNEEHLDANAARVAIDSFKWLAARENNGRYGDRITVEDDGPRKTLTREDTLAQLAASNLSIADVFGALTKPAEPVPALPGTPSSPSPAADILDIE